MQNRIINIDWLEVFVAEPADSARDALYFEQHGWKVKRRDHGTPQYREMFTICDNKGRPFIEVRRNPYSVKGEDGKGGLFYANDCHLRLSNFACYGKDPVGKLQAFMSSHKYQFKSVSRVDVCLDFQRFDSGDYPKEFIQRYVAGKYRKLNQIQAYAYQHEVNLWKKQEIERLKKAIAYLESTSDYETNYHAFDRACSTRDGEELSMEYNYISWHCPSSPIGTKLYNKTQEIGREGHQKGYIRKQWEQLYRDGIFTNELDVYRLEFSIRGVVRGYVHGETGEVIRIDLEQLSTKEGLMKLFGVLTEKYFRFCHTEKTEEGNLKTKTRSKQKELFSFSDKDHLWRNLPPEPKEHSNRKLNMLLSSLKAMASGELGEITDAEQSAVWFLLNKLKDSYYTNNRLIPRIEEFKETEVYVTEREATQIADHVRAINEIVGYDYGDKPDFEMTSEGDTRNPWKRAIDERRRLRAINQKLSQRRQEESPEDYAKWQKFLGDY